MAMMKFAFLLEDTDGEIAVIDNISSGMVAQFAKDYAAEHKVGVSVYAGSDGKHLANYGPNGGVIYFN